MKTSFPDPPEPAPAPEVKTVRLKSTYPPGFLVNDVDCTAGMEFDSTEHHVERLFEAGRAVYADPALRTPTPEEIAYERRKATGVLTPTEELRRCVAELEAARAAQKGG